MTLRGKQNGTVLGGGGQYSGAGNSFLLQYLNKTGERMVAWYLEGHVIQGAGIVFYYCIKCNATT